jgi:FkbM family methyltransferase
VHVRHRSRDLDILTEIFGRGTYEPPRALAPKLQGPLRVTDAGGNIGLFGVFALERWDVTSIVSYEPDPLNAQLLMATAAPHPRWRVIPAAVSNIAGTLQFRAGMHSESRAALPGEEGLTVPTVDVYDGAAADLFKMDIEGGEWPILTDTRLAGLATRAVVLEWHANGCPAPDPGEHARRLLREAGFTEQHRGEECPENGLLWAWRP